MEFLDEALAKYIEQHTDEEPALLKELNGRYLVQPQFGCYSKT